MPAETQLRVGVVGLGYIGLPTAAVIARTGARVVGIDVNPHVVETINRGQIHIEEANLDALVHQVVTSGHLAASLSAEPCDVFVIAVPTPFDDDHRPDISYVLKAGETIAPVLKRGDLVILESTSPVGTTEQLRDLFAAARPDLSFPQGWDDSADVCVAYCPERVLPGKILFELVDNDRSIGGISATCADRATAFYKRFVEGACIVNTARTAEMCKLVENSFRDVNIAFANELSIVCDTLELDVWEVIRLANRHPRVNILQPGPGVGGHCIAVDPWFIVHSDPANARLIRTAREVNDGKIGYSFDRAAALADDSTNAARVWTGGFSSGMTSWRGRGVTTAGLPRARGQASRAAARGGDRRLGAVDESPSPGGRGFQTLTFRASHAPFRASEIRPKRLNRPA